MYTPNIAGLSAEKLRQLVHYDPETGLFTRRVSRARGRAGSVMGKVDPGSGGYVRIPVNNGLHRAHRLAWLYMTGQWPTQFIDHIDRDRTNNRWCNLREACPTVNAQNASRRLDNKSGIKGVSWCNTQGKWMAQIRVQRKTKFLGYYENLEDARTARQAAEALFHPFYAQEY